MRNNRSDKQGWLPYWVNPVTATLMIVGISLLLYVLVPEATFMRQFRQLKADTSLVMVTHLLATAAMLIGVVLGMAAIGNQSGGRTSPAEHDSIIRGIGYSSLYLALFGYAVYFGLSKAPPELYLRALTGQKGAIFALKTTFEKVPGVTSFMNLSCWWFLYLTHHRIIRQTKLTKGMIVGTWMLVALSLVRAFAVNERRIVFEIAIPAIVYALFFIRDIPIRWRNIINLAPVGGAVGLSVVFLVTEYFRSWVNFFSNGRSDIGYLEYGLSRLAGYYVTAMNNGVNLIREDIRMNGYLTFGGAMKMPLIADVGGFVELRREMATRYTISLMQFSNPELNNPGGIISPIGDYGFFLGLLLLLFFGLAFGVIYGLARVRNVWGVLYYSIVFFGFMEITRLWYVGTANSIIGFVFLAIFWAVRQILYRPVARPIRAR